MPARAKKTVLTEKFIELVKPVAGTRSYHWDALVPNFGIRITDKGAVSFVVSKRPRGEKRIVNTILGPHPALKLAEARGKAREVLRLLDEGKRPRDVEQERLREQARTRANTFEAVANQFCDDLEASLIPKARGDGPMRKAKGLADLVRKMLVPAWRDRPISEISKRDVRELVTKIHRLAPAQAAPGKRRKAGGPHAARHVFNAARRVFGWMVDTDLLEDSPCDGIKGQSVHGGAAGARSRVLSDPELLRVWSALEATRYPYGDLCRLLLLTGQRRGELSDLRWSEVDLDNAMITLPPERMKAGKAHTVPLAPRAKSLLESLPRFPGGDFVFTTTGGRTAFCGFSKAKRRLDQIVGDMPAWQVHDLRRSARTGMSRCGIAVFVAELVISHAQKGVHGVYDKHSYDIEKLDALQRWETRLTSIIDPPPNNVIGLRNFG